MDRALRIDRINQPGLGLATIEGIDPRDLAVQAARVFARFASYDQGDSFVVGMSLAGGGDGAAWRVVFLSGSALGPNVQSSILPQLAHARFALARQFAEIDAVAARLLAEIQDDYPNAFVVETQIAGGGRDGVYLLAVLFSDGLPAPLLLSAFEPNEVEIPGPTNVVSITVPGTASGTPKDQCSVLIQWSVAVEDPSSGGYTAALWDDTGSVAVEIYAEVGDNGQWQCAAGVYVQSQPTIDVVYAVRVSPVFAPPVNARDASIVMQLVPRDLSLS